MKKLIFIILFISQIALANDRSALVQARITSAIGNIISKSDFLVTVNRADQLEDGGQNEVISGTLKPLPGLNVGVDAKGQVVRQDAQAIQYNGPIVITVLLDKSVQEETFSMINQMLPEIAGGLRDLDEYKVRRATLRQPNSPDNNAAVNVNNIMPGDQSNQWNDSLRFFAILLLTAGMFAWLLSRVLGTQPKSNSDRSLGGSAFPTPEDLDEKPKTDWTFTPSVVGIYLLKCLKEKKTSSIKCWLENSSISQQREVLKSLPSWVTSYLQSQIDEKHFLNDVIAQPMSAVYRDITVLEQHLNQPEDYAIAFLQWFPAPGLRYVPKQYQKSLSNSSRKTLWSLRPDLGEFVHVDNMGLHEVSEPKSTEIINCFKEISTWPSTAFVANKSEQQDMVSILASKLNQIYEFGPLQVQVDQARTNLSPDDFTRLMSLTVSTETPLQWDAEKRKDWLRLVDPQDYFWWYSITTQKPTWQLEQELRPMRKAMFKFAELNPAFPTWSEADKKSASSRMLKLFRSIHLGEGSYELDQAA